MAHKCKICKKDLSEIDAFNHIENGFEPLCEDSLCHAKYEGIPMPWDSGFGSARTMEFKEVSANRILYAE